MKPYTARWILYLLGLSSTVIASTVWAETPKARYGCYAGSNPGYGWADIGSHDLASEATGSATAQGAAFEMQAGCDYQTVNWVYGLQLALNKAHFTGSHLFVNGSSNNDRVFNAIKNLTTFSGRIGYALQPNALAYLSTGAAWAKTDSANVEPLTPPAYEGNKQIVRQGWLFAIGAEYALQHNLSLFAEYNYMHFGKKKTTLSYDDGSTYDYTFKQDLNFLKFGLNYRFK